MTSVSNRPTVHTRISTCIRSLGLGDSVGEKTVGLAHLEWLAVQEIVAQRLYATVYAERSIHVRIAEDHLFKKELMRSARMSVMTLRWVSVFQDLDSEKTYVWGASLKKYVPNPR